MINFTFGVPVETRLPLRAWVLAALVTMFSLASSIMDSHGSASCDIRGRNILAWESTRIIKVWLVTTLAETCRDGS